jgi:hypothetical protein
MQRLAAIVARFIILPAIVLLAGCAQLQLGQPVPSIDNIQKARASGIAPLSLGHFAIAPGKDVSLDQKVSARSNTIYSPYASSFARYLKETLAADLAAAGLLDPASAIVVEGWLTDSQLDVPTGQARGSVAARFTLTKAGARIYDKEHRASATWAASFVGVEAVPGAINEYGLLYRKLVAMLLDDPAFRAAAKP